MTNISVFAQLSLMNYPQLRKLESFDSETSIITDCSLLFHKLLMSMNNDMFCNNNSYVTSGTIHIMFYSFIVHCATGGGIYDGAICWNDVIRNICSS